MRLLLCLLLLPGVAAAEIYRWVDANGQVHFAQRPVAPAAEQVEVRPQVIERDQATRGREERAARFFEARRAEQAQASLAAAERQARRAQECGELRRRLAQIPEGRRYFHAEGNGERIYYSDEQLAAARRQLRDRIAGRCS